LSEYLFYFVKWGLVSSQDLQKLSSNLKQLPDSELIENNANCQIKRTHPREITINNVIFNESKIEYPLLIHNFKGYEIITEIVVKEKQRAVGAQAMLYLCFPITELKSELILLGRTSKTNETANFILDKNNFQIVPEMMRIFGMLSKSHKEDILAILELLT
jgi:hypothetical protein